MLNPSQGTSITQEDDAEIVLPDPRAVNREISRKMKEERERERTYGKRGVKLWAGLVRTAEQNRPGDLFGQLAYCLHHGKLPAGCGRARDVGDATRRKFGTNLQRAFNDLRLERISIRNLSELNRKHVIKLVKRYTQAKLAPATVTCRITDLRKLFVLMGRPGEIPTGAAWKRLLRDHGIEPEALRRSSIRVVPKSVSSKGLRPEDIIARVDERHRVERMWLALQCAFGLRPRECAELDPLESDRGDVLLVLHGAKAKRKRAISFSKDPQRRAEQRASLDEAKELSKNVLKHHQWKLRTADRNTDQALNHFYYVMRKSGITKAELGVVAYSMRHEFANLEFEEVCGLPAPVLRKTDPQEYEVKAEAVEAAHQHVVQQLGHSNRYKSGAYNGSPHEEYRRVKRQKAMANIFQDDAALDSAVQRAGIEEVWLVGKAASGDKLAAGESIQLAMRLSRALTTDALLQVSAAVERLSRRVEITWCGQRPEAALELVFPHQRQATRPGGPVPIPHRKL